MTIDAAWPSLSCLRELASVYLSCSWAMESLSIYCPGYVPLVLANAADESLLAVSRNPTNVGEIAAAMQTLIAAKPGTGG